MYAALASQRLFFSLCLALALVFAHQTLLNRGAPVYGTWWFAALGVLLAVNIGACALRRRDRRPHFLLIHAGLVLVIAGAFVTRAFRFEAELPLRVGAASDMAYAKGASYRLPFSVTLEDFRLEYYAEPLGTLTIEDGEGIRSFDAREGSAFRSGGTEIKVLRLVRDFGLDGKGRTVEKSPYWLNPAAQVRISAPGVERKLWVFSNFPGMHDGELPFRLFYGLEQAEIKDFVSSVTVRGAAGPATAEIAVNRPLRLPGYTLYQTSYDPADARYSLLTVTRDRGIWTVYAGFAALLLGILLWLKK